MWKNTVEPDRPQMTIRRMRIACWISKDKNTPSEYLILIAFPRQQWINERASVLWHSALPVLYSLRLILHHHKLGACTQIVRIYSTLLPPSVRSPVRTYHIATLSILPKRLVTFLGKYKSPCDPMPTLQHFVEDEARDGSWTPKLLSSNMACFKIKILLHHV
jgi:hypothetical protein